MNKFIISDIKVSIVKTQSAGADYTVSHNVNISYSHFFTEPIGYYLKNSFLMFFFQALTNPFYAIIKAIKT